MSKIKIALRVRPLSKKEREEGAAVVVQVQQNNAAFVTDLKVPLTPSADSRPRTRQFQFDHAFTLEDEGTGGASQSQVYEELGPFLERSLMDGYNSTLLAYGQSGSGKTHTTWGSRMDPGIIPRLSHSIWLKISASSNSSKMEVSFMEIYREKVVDLFGWDKGHLKLRQHPQYDLTRKEVKDESTLLDLLWEGEARRTIGTSGSNCRSSRSHAIWTIYLTIRNPKQITTNQAHLVDLAGSEKCGFSTKISAKREGADINRSLVALGNVISSLAEKGKYIPYRDSALTFILKESLGGNSSTAVIITASPASTSHQQTLNSFRFAERASLVENSPRVNISAFASSARELHGAMSTTEIKKDISKLSQIIKSAQNFASIACFWMLESVQSDEMRRTNNVGGWWRFQNGGILRGITPRASWTRLISALEGWNQIEGEHLKLKQEEECKNKSCTDAESQVDLVAAAPSTMSSTRTPATEVFIPVSSSIKCLTWEQELIQPPPTTTDNLKAPPTTPPPSSQLEHNILLQHPPLPPQQLDHASRISERIHRSLSSLPKREKVHPLLVPLEEEGEGDSSCLLIRHRIPTLINCSSAIAPHKTGKKKVLCTSSVEALPVHPINATFAASSTPKQFLLPTAKEVKVFEGLEEEDFSVLEEFAVKQSRLGLIRKGLAKEGTLTLQLPKRPSLFSKMEGLSSHGLLFEDIYEVDSTEEGGGIESLHEWSDAESYSCSATSTNSSETSWNYCKASPTATAMATATATAPKLIQVRSVPQELFSEEEFEEVFPFEAAAAPAAAAAEGKDNPAPIPISIQELDVSLDDSPKESKFRNYFSRELSKMDKIGKQLKSLQKISQQGQRFTLVQPYLDKIFELEGVDHAAEDPELDRKIEECSGWSVETELGLVHKEINSLTKLLKTGISTENRRASESSGSSSLGSSSSSSRRGKGSSGRGAPNTSISTSLSLSPPECRRSTPSGGGRLQRHPTATATHSSHLRNTYSDHALQYHWQSYRDPGVSPGIGQQSNLMNQNRFGNYREALGRDRRSLSGFEEILFFDEPFHQSRHHPLPAQPQPHLYHYPYQPPNPPSTNSTPLEEEGYHPAIHSSTSTSSLERYYLGLRKVSNSSITSNSSGGSGGGSSSSSSSSRVKGKSLQSSRI